MIEITITDDGEVRCLAPDDLDLRVLGPLHVRRASHVEFNEARQEWTVTLPNGRELGRGFPTRREALDAEVGALNAMIDEGSIEEVFGCRG